MSLLVLNTILGSLTSLRLKIFSSENILFYKMDLVVMAQADCSGLNTGCTANCLHIVNISQAVNQQKFSVCCQGNLHFYPSLDFVS